MTTVAHSSLTGSDLHEPKGVASASANTLYVANGAGSGTWTQVPAAALASNVNSFGNFLFHVAEIQAFGTNSPNNFTGSVVTVSGLNTVLTNDQPSVYTWNSGSSSITCAPGTYYCDIDGVMGFGGSNTGCRFQYRLHDISHNVDVAVSDSGYAWLAATATLNGRVRAAQRFTLNNTSTLQLQGVSTVNAIGGYASGALGVEVYSQLRLWKVA